MKRTSMNKGVASETGRTMSLDEGQRLTLFLGIAAGSVFNLQRRRGLIESPAIQPWQRSNLNTLKPQYKNDGFDEERLAKAQAKRDRRAKRPGGRS